MIMEDTKNESNNSFDRSMSPISESLSETSSSSAAESNSSNILESDGQNADDILDEINRKTETGMNINLMFIYIKQLPSGHVSLSL